jgi:hypothetical protein
MAPDETVDYSSDPMTLDANAVGGLLQQLFGSDMTAVASQCAHCGNQAMVGSLRAYVGLGVVLRCSICQEIVVRIAEMPDGTHRVDVRGATYLRM